jgi:hypothetical protein
MATVYLGFDPAIEREVAVKVLPQALTHDATFLERFTREARIVATLEHPAIVPIYDFGQEGARPYIIMRYMPGGTLGDRITEGALSLAEATRMIEALAPGLDEAHRRGFVHRDLKPGNILFDHNDQPYISDFGISKLAENAGSLTGSGIIGTPAYMSPEQARGETVDGRSDLYALGTIVFEMLTGRQPYTSETPMGAAVRHITDPVPRILEANPGLPEGCEAIILRAMAKQAGDRYPTAAALASDLRAVLEDRPLGTVISHPLPAQTVSLAPSAQPHHDRTRRASGLLATLGLTQPISDQFKKAIPESRSAARNRSRIMLGAALVGGALGLVILNPLTGGHALRYMWPMIILLPGVFGMYIMTHGGPNRHWIAYPSTLLIMLGLLLFYQNTFSHWASWAYAWTLIPASLGVGMVVSGVWAGEPLRAQRGLKVARAFVVLGTVLGVFFEVLFAASGGILRRIIFVGVMLGVGIYLLRRKEEAVPEEDELLTRL